MEIRTNPIVTFTNEETTTARMTLETGKELVRKVKETFPQNVFSTIFIAGLPLSEISWALATLEFLREDNADIYVAEPEADDPSPL